MKKVNYQNISLEKENISLEILTCGLMSMTGEYFRLPTFTIGHCFCLVYIFQDSS